MRGVFPRVSRIFPVVHFRRLKPFLPLLLVVPALLGAWVWWAPWNRAQRSIASGDPARAIEILKDSMESGPFGRFKDEALREHLLQAYFAKGDLDGVERSSRDILERYPRNPAAHYSLGVVFWAREQYVFAAEEFSESVRLDPTFLEQWRGLVQVLLSSNKPAEALEKIGLAEKHFPQDLQLKILKGVAFDQSGQTLEARELFEEALKASSPSLRVIRFLYYFDLNSGDFERAQKLLDFLKTRDPISYEYYLGHFYGATGRWEKAFSTFSEMRRQDHNDLLAGISLSEACLFLGRSNDALALLDDIGARLPPLSSSRDFAQFRSIQDVSDSQARKDHIRRLHADYELARARLNLFMGRTSDALPRLKSAAAFSPFWPIPRLLAFYIESNFLDDESLRKILVDLVKSFPTDPSVLFAAATFDLSRGDPSKAKAVRESLFKNYPLHWAGPVLDFEIQLIQKAGPRPTESLIRAAALFPFEPHAQSALARLLAASGQARAAEDAFQRSITLAPWSSEFFARYASFLSSQGRQNEARMAWKRASTLSPMRVRPTR